MPYYSVPSCLNCVTTVKIISIILSKLFMQFAALCYLYLKMCL